MTTYQESRLSMYMATRDFLTANTAIVSPLPSFTNLQTSFVSTVAQIQTIREQQEFDKTGITDSKKVLRDSLIKLAIDTSRKMIAFCTMNSNQVLLSEINYSDSKLRLSPDTVLKDRCQVIYDRAQSNLAGLAQYGIAAPTQTNLLNAINAFNAYIPKPRLGITEKKNATEQLKKLFEAGDGLLDKMDVLVEVIRLTQVNFYNGYRDARKQVETGTGSLALRGLAVDSLTSEPLKNVVFKFMSNGNGNGSNGNVAMLKVAKTSADVVKKTAERGHFNVKSMPEGTYMVRVSKPGYKDQEITANVSNGELTELVVRLEKN